MSLRRTHAVQAQRIYRERVAEESQKKLQEEQKRDHTSAVFEEIDDRANAKRTYRITLQEQIDRENEAKAEKVNFLIESTNVNDVSLLRFDHFYLFNFL